MKFASMDAIPGVSRASVSVKTLNRIQTILTARNGPLETQTTPISTKVHEKETYEAEYL